MGTGDPVPSGPLFFPMLCWLPSLAQPADHGDESWTGTKLIAAATRDIAGQLLPLAAR